MFTMRRLSWNILCALMCIVCYFHCGYTLDVLGGNGEEDPQTESDYERGLYRIVSEFLPHTHKQHQDNKHNDESTSPRQHDRVNNDTTHDDTNQTHQGDKQDTDNDDHRSHNEVGGLFSKFPCRRLGPSQDKPHSVHRLRPADIDVIAAMGDSLTAGKAAGTKGVAAVLFDYRGLSWSVGGDGTFQTLHSLPNILREYNPDLYGFSNSIGDLMSQASRMNVAKSGATSDNLAFQASLLIQRLKNDPNVDFYNDWKVITILIGANDLCRSCKARYTPKRYIRRLKSALDILLDSVPRAFVNLVEVMPVELARFLPRDAFCKRIETYYCGCAVDPQTESQYRLVVDNRKEIQRLTEELVASGEYDHKEDFTVVLQPFYKNFNIQMIPGTDLIDYSIFAVDCFHLSMQGQSRGGLGLWNNMLQPVGNKSTDWNITKGMLCPTEAQPFLATAKNSKTMHGKLRGLVQHSWLAKTTSPIRKLKLKHKGHDRNLKSYAEFSLNVVNKMENIRSGKDHQRSDKERVMSVNSSINTSPNTNNQILDTDDNTTRPPSSPSWWSDRVTILDEPDTWAIWSIVLGWTLMMSSVLVYCVSMKNSRRNKAEKSPASPAVVIETINKDKH